MRGESPPRTLKFQQVVSLQEPSLGELELRCGLGELELKCGLGKL